MKTTTRFRRSVVVVLAPLAPILGGCGAEKPMPPAAPVAASPQASVGKANMQPAQLPNTATATNVSISDEILRACNIPDGNAYFAFDSSNLTAFDHGPLDAVAACFTRGPMAGRKLLLVGHADPRGASEYNITLGQSRADGVDTYLTGRGMSAANLGSTSRGAMDAMGHDETGWAHDRRVDVLLAK